MKLRWACGLLAAGLLLAGCGEQGAAEIRALEARISVLNQRATDQADEHELLKTEVDGLRTATAMLRDENAALRDRPDAGPVAPPDTSALEARIDGLEERLKSLEEAKTAESSTPTDPAEEPPPVSRALPIKVVRELLAQLLPMIESNPGDRKSIGEYINLLQIGDKEDRDQAIEAMEKLVAADPESKEARMALASVLQTRFRDVRQGIKQGALATRIKEHVSKALDLDSEFYDAQHYLAIMQVGYPVFMEVFKTADKDLDKALELQAKLPWEDLFAEIYAAYGEWHLKKGEHELALKKVQEGLDKAPRNQGLLNQKKKIEAAQAKESEG